MTASDIHLYTVRNLGCIICSRPASLHHSRSGLGMGQKASDWRVIPLCPSHHQHGPFGKAIHNGKKTFEKEFGTEDELLVKTIRAAYDHREYPLEVIDILEELNV